MVVDGCPPRLAISLEEIQRDLDRRRSGQSHLTTPRDEADRAEILSGVFEGQTLGTPTAIRVRNQDAPTRAYDHMKDVYRPSHADYTYEAKCGIPNWQGRGRASARDDRARRGGSHRAQTTRYAMRRRKTRLGFERPRDRGEDRRERGDAHRRRGESRALPGSRCGRRDGARDRRRATSRRFTGGRRRVRRAPRSGGARRQPLPLAPR